MVVYVVATRDPATENLSFVGHSTNLESAKKSARERAKKEGVKTLVFEASRILLRVNERGEDASS